MLLSLQVHNLHHLQLLGRSLLTLEAVLTHPQIYSSGTSELLCQVYILGEEGFFGRQDRPRHAAWYKMRELACSHAILFPFLAFRGCALTWVFGWIENNSYFFFLCMARDNILIHIFKKNFFAPQKGFPLTNWILWLFHL